MTPINLLYISLLIALLVVSIFLQLFLMRWGLKRRRIADVSLWKAFVLILLASVVAGLVMTFVFALFAATSIHLPKWVESLSEMVALAVILSFIVAAIYKSNFKQSIYAVLPAIAAPWAVAIAAVLIMRSFLFESYTVPTNAMAPTILGRHVEAKCPDCGRTSYGSPPHNAIGSPRVPEEFNMICGHEYKPIHAKSVDQNVYQGDRISVCKFITPKRWDCIVFDLPADPSVKYVKRLVGMPGETIVIRDGAVWADGQRLTPPQPINRIEYLDTIEFAPEAWGSPSNPAKLGPDEYFVLGDFSAQSYDSRFWNTGAPGHPPYAVPKSHIVGVVIHTYWPISRWRAFR